MHAGLPSPISDFGYICAYDLDGRESSFLRLCIMMTINTPANDPFTTLAIDAYAVAARGLPRHEECTELIFADFGIEGRKYLLRPDAADAWHAMKAAAATDGISLIVASAFRSVARQVELIEKKLDEGQSIEQILTYMAPPGYSEHHSGRAIDIVTPACPKLEEWFDTTTAFAWLTEHAANYRFTLSLPRGNSLGFVYEPWHWCYHAPSDH